MEMWKQSDKKPAVVIHRLPTCDTFLTTHLTTMTNYTLIDPIPAAGPDAVRAYLRLHGRLARALLCIESIPLPSDLIDCLPSLECIVSSTTGTDHIALSHCRRRGISVTNLGDAFAVDVADYAVGLLLDVLMKVSAGDRFVRAGSWVRQPDFSLGSSIRGKQVGIVGLGNIGHRVAKRLIPFGCSIAYNSRKKNPNVTFPYYSDLHQLALNTDILILCCSLTDQTRHMVNKDLLNALGKEGIVINVGRGALIDEGELVRFLVDGTIAGAGLDVFEDEPNVPKELFGLENVVLSAHHAVCTPQSFQAIVDVVLANLEAFFSNKPLLTPVNLE